MSVQTSDKILVTGHQPQETGYLVNGDRILISVTCVKHPELGHFVTLPVDSGYLAR